jgi:hypothetical protein
MTPTSHVASTRALASGADLILVKRRYRAITFPDRHMAQDYVRIYQQVFSRS